jgi:hypothetical protein
MDRRHGSARITFLSFVFATLFLTGWFVYWEARHQGLGSVGNVIGNLPFGEDFRDRSEAWGTLGDAFLSTDGDIRTYLILFQNSLELRPGGGFIGSFGILKIRDRRIVSFEVRDTGIFDAGIQGTIEPPYPMAETLRIDSWKLRDSNWDPDFSSNARRATDFYRIGGGQERFDGVIGITADVLSSFLSVTGPVSISGFPGTYDSESGIFDLEYQVEQAYREQDIPFSERKSVLGTLGSEILSRVGNLPPKDLLTLFGVVLDDLRRKDIQLFFFDGTLQESARRSGWDGGFDGEFSGDFLLVVDANLDAWKTDSVMERSYRYEVDFSDDIPHARLTVSYRHTGFEKNFMVKDYQSFVRVYVPDGSWFRGVSGGVSEPVYGEFMGRRYVGVLTGVPLGESRDIIFEYDLPERMMESAYDLKIVRQPGTKDIPVELVIISRDGSRTMRNIVLDRDYVLNKDGM